MTYKSNSVKIHPSLTCDCVPSLVSIMKVLPTAQSIMLQSLAFELSNPAKKKDTEDVELSLRNKYALLRKLVI